MAQAAVSGVCFFASCLFNLSVHSAALGSGLAALFLLAQMLVNAGQSLSWLKYLTLFSLFHPARIAAGESAGAAPYILCVISLLLYGSAIWVFNKKDLPI